MKNIIDKLKELATNKNVSIAEIRNCIGNDRFYRIADGKSDLPLGKLKKLSKILNLNDTEKLWLINDNAEAPKTEKQVGIDIVLNEIGSLRQEIAELKEEIKHTPKSQEAEGEKKLALKLKKKQCPPLNMAI